MADEEQLAILKQGVDAWNAWRKESHAVRPDLSGAGLSRADLSEADLIRAVLSCAYLSEAYLSDANLSEADLSDANLSDANLSGANLSGANLSEAYLSGADLSEAVLIRATLRGTDLSDADFFRADLSYADLIGADLSDANLSGANLNGTKLDHADLFRTDLSEADLIGADLRGATLGKTTLGRVNLDKVRGLASCHHYGPSTVGQDTLELSKGKIPAVFLKGCGFSDWQILYAKLHDPNLRRDEVTSIGYEVINMRSSSPIQINSVFISYSSKDAEFAEAIEQRLDLDGIRSWRDSHEMLPGPIEPQIDRAIELNKTVLLVLSKNSVESDWVEWEVEQARKLQKKLQGGQADPVYVLCPVALDDSWQSCRWEAPLMKQLKRNHIMDYSDWQAKDAFEAKYQKLKKALGIFYRKEED